MVHVLPVSRMPRIPRSVDSRLKNLAPEAQHRFRAQARHLEKYLSLLSGSVMRNVGPAQFSGAVRRPCDLELSHVASTIVSSWKMHHSFSS